jgi:hypothetical protein
LLHGRNDDEIRKMFAIEHPTSEASAIDDAIAKIRGSVLFRPLLTDAAV